MNFSLFTHHPRSGLRLAIAASLLFAFAAPPTARAVSEPSPLTGEKKSYQYSWQDEIKLGAEADKEITEQMGLYDNPEMQAYIQALGQRVLSTSTFNDPKTHEMYRNTKFTFRVLDSPVVNAFALPGGYVYVTRGLLSHVDNEAQLAVVLGHEIAHVAARHASVQARRSMWGQIGVIAGAILGQQILGERMPNIGETILQTGGPAMQTFLLKYSREAEHEADTYGVTWAARSGYAAADSARFFNTLQRLSGAEGKSLPSWQSSHPDPGDRANRVRQLAAQVAPGASANTGEEDFLRRIEGLIVGEDPRQGFAQNNVFYHPELRFQMPLAAGWKFENQPAAVVLAEPEGRAMMGLRMAPGGRGREAASEFVSKNKIQVTGSGETYVNGLPATVIMGQATSEQGTVGVWNAFIEMENKVYSILGYAPTQVFEQMRPTFERVAAGFGPLRDPSILNIQPARLKIVRAERSAPFASFVPTSLPPSMKAEEVALMNQLNLDQNVPAGSFLKIPDTAAYRGPATLDDRRNQNYPNQQQPQPYPSQYPPPSGYPQGQYPQHPGNYPPANYPAQNYPPGQPSNYPQGPQNYPQYPQYPDSRGQSPNYPTYPQQSYPQQSYPQQSYPQQYPQSYPQQNYPQFPQPGQQPQQPNQQPAWPR